MHNRNDFVSHGKLAHLAGSPLAHHFAQKSEVLAACRQYPLYGSALAQAYYDLTLGACELQQHRQA
jgi:hypothetical protein